MKKTASLLAVLLSACSLALSSCSDDDDNSSMSGPYFNFVTVKTINDYTINFIGQRENSDEDINIHCSQSSQAAAKDYPPGTRTFISYNLDSKLDNNPDPFSTTIQLLTITKAIVPEIVSAPLKDCLTGPSTAKISMAPYRTGKYINMLLRMPKIEGRTFKCFVSEESLSTSTPKLFLYSTANSESPDHFNADHPISIDISGQWNRPSVTGLTLTIATAEEETPKTYTFTK